MDGHQVACHLTYGVEGQIECLAPRFALNINQADACVNRQSMGLAGKCVGQAGNMPRHQPVVVVQKEQ